MGMYASGGIFQEKSYKLIGDVEFVKTYIGDLLFVIK